MALPDPVTRKEMYLNKAATGSGSVPPEPVTREEMYLAEIANGGGSGGASEPLVLTLVPDSAQNPFAGTFTGGTGEEIQAAWSAGRNVIADFPGFGSMAVNMNSSDVAQTNFTYTQGSTTYFALLTISYKIMRYSVRLFSGLTPVT